MSNGSVATATTPHEYRNWGIVGTQTIIAYRGSLQAHFKLLKYIKSLPDIGYATMEYSLLFFMNGEVAVRIREGLGSILGLA